MNFILYIYLEASGAVIVVGSSFQEKRDKKFKPFNPYPLVIFCKMKQTYGMQITSTIGWVLRCNIYTLKEYLSYQTVCVSILIPLHSQYEYSIAFYVPLLHKICQYIIDTFLPRYCRSIGQSSLGITVPYTPN